MTASKINGESGQESIGESDDRTEYITLHRCTCGDVSESRLDFYDHIAEAHDAFQLVTNAMLDSSAEVPAGLNP